MWLSRNLLQGLIVCGMTCAWIRPTIQGYFGRRGNGSRWSWTVQSSFLGCTDCMHFVGKLLDVFIDCIRICISN